MDQGYAYVRSAGIIVAAALLVACSASSASGGDPASAGGDAGQTPATDGGGGAGDDAAPPNYEALESKCAGTFGAVRQRCCAQYIPDGVQELRLAQEDCACGPCVSACNYQECTTFQSGVAACQSCLQATLATCASTVSAACAADPGCAAYQACLAQ